MLTFILQVWNHLMKCQWQSFWVCLSTGERVYCGEQPCTYLLCICKVLLHTGYWDAPENVLELQNAIKCNLYESRLKFFYFTIFSLSLHVSRLEGENWQTRIYIWVNTADDFENERMGKLLVEPVERSMTFIILLRYIFKVFYLSVLLQCLWLRVFLK